jgi:hypothetical protein
MECEPYSSRNAGGEDQHHGNSHRAELIRCVAEIRSRLAGVSVPVMIARQEWSLRTCWATFGLSGVSSVRVLHNHDPLDRSARSLC